MALNVGRLSISLVGRGSALSATQRRGLDRRMPTLIGTDARKWRPKDHAALSRCPFVKPPALPEVADIWPSFSSAAGARSLLFGAATVCWPDSLNTVFGNH